MIRLFILSLLFSSIVSKCNAQIFDRLNDGVPIKNYASGLGAMQDRPLSNIIDSFKAQNYDEVKLTYAIYAWIALNISFDSKAFHKKEKANSTTSATLKRRKASSEGYANLFQTMCDVAGIRCYTIEGLAKIHPKEILNITDKNKHFWNVVLIKNLLLFIDVTWAAGETDENRKNFEQEYSDAWFLTNKDIFLLSRYTNDKNNPVPADKLPSKVEFSKAPIVYRTAVPLSIYPTPTTKGKIRGRVGKTTTIYFEMRDESVAINSVELVAKGNITQVPANRFDNGTLSVDINFKESGNYPIYILVRGKKIYGFMANVSKAR